jgi:hypothetical protein
MDAILRGWRKRTTVFESRMALRKTSCSASAQWSWIASFKKVSRLPSSVVT